MDYHLEKSILRTQAIYTVTLDTPTLTEKNLEEFTQTTSDFNSRVAVGNGGNRNVKILLKNGKTLIIFNYNDGSSYLNSINYDYIEKDFNIIINQYLNILKLFL